MTLIFFLFAFLFSTTISHVSARDFCVADLKGRETSVGYPCKSPNNVTVDDFVFSNFKVGTLNQFNFSFTPAFVDHFPALNGVGLSFGRVEVKKGGAVPMHTHADATEVIISTGGKYTAGFITSDNRVYTKTLTEGNIFVIPKGLLHFGVNVGKGKASGIVVFTSEKPSVQILDIALFGNNLDSGIVGKTTFLDVAQIKKLKALFKGSG
ncbi:hypothetical protein Lal_00012290 [Lupinus albus]|uniref:Germin-like protein n=1 Tax=Lupinus albus TaxID=3870 RepID=A0A6A5MGD9_LUPAL|nr:putative germin, rmlC-like jelly roll [Lupinus albus]KAF1872069.1 hypothetical protein Lal_00012290 [Lupinus albus]